MTMTPEAQEADAVNMSDLHEPTLLILIGSVRPGRVAKPVSEWVKHRADLDGRFIVDVADFNDFRLPFLDEPHHPKLRTYSHEHTRAWSAKVNAADAFIFVSPEYNHSYAPVLKNAIDFLFYEWRHKPVGIVSYGGISAGTRGVAALDPVINSVGLLKALTSVAIPDISKWIGDDGAFQSVRGLDDVLTMQLDELRKLASVLKPLRAEHAVLPQ